MEKMFTVAGYSTLEGKTQIRVANSMDRVKVLKRNGHTNIKMWELPNAMIKEAATAYVELLKQGTAAAPQVHAEGEAQRIDAAEAKLSNLEKMRAVSKRMKKLDAQADESDKLNTDWKQRYDDNVELV